MIHILKQLLLCSLVLPVLLSKGQTSSIYNMDRQLLAVSFDSSSALPKRNLVVFQKCSSRLNPLAWLGAGMLFVYQNVFSEQIQADCVYEVSCSEHTKQAISQHGIVRGLLEGFNQLSECAPGARYEHPDLYINRQEKIRTEPEEVHP